MGSKYKKHQQNTVGKAKASYVLGVPGDSTQYLSRQETDWNLEYLSLCKLYDTTVEAVCLL